MTASVDKVPLTQLQERVASLVTGLPEAEGFVLAGGAAMAAHGVLDRTTRDLDYFGGPEQAAAVHRLAAAVSRPRRRRVWMSAGTGNGRRSSGCASPCER